MPKLRKTQTRKVYLPTFAEEKKEEDRVWLKIETPVRPVDFDSVDTSQSQIMQTANVMSKKIKEWNLIGEDDKPLAITPENIASLEAVDFTFISVELGLDKIVRLATQKKSL